MNLVDDELTMVVVAASHNMSAPGASSLAPLTICDEQRPVPLGDEYNGEPGINSLKWEGQGVCTRPGTDVYISGHAWAPRGRKVGRNSVSVRVGSCGCSATVFGERSWVQRVGGRAPSTPDLFERVPLLYERSFGGSVDGALGDTALASDHNPVGRGIHAEPEHHPLPNIEDPRHLLTSLRDRPPPRGFGPIARGWLPRRKLAGSYTQSWIDERAPLWPRDTDPRFFIAASPGLAAVPHLRGGELVTLTGTHPDGDLHFELPRLRLLARFEQSESVDRRLLVLDALMIEPDSLRMISIWRASVIVRPSMLALQRTVLRELESWEEHPTS